MCLRYAAVLGNWAGPNNSIPGRLIRAVGAAKKNGGRLLIDDNTLVWNGGEEFIDARDCAYANVAALQAASPEKMKSAITSVRAASSRLPIIWQRRARLYPVCSSISKVSRRAASEAFR